jgi:hypothetical protein
MHAAAGRNEIRQFRRVEQDVARHFLLPKARQEQPAVPSNHIEDSVPSRLSPVRGEGDYAAASNLYLFGEIEQRRGERGIDEDVVAGDVVESRGCSRGR